MTINTRMLNLSHVPVILGKPVFWKFGVSYYGFFCFLIIENNFVEDLDMGMLQDTHPDHDFYQCFSEPSDFGFTGLARYRTWVIGSHRERSTALQDPFEVLDAVREACSATPGARATIRDFLVSSKNEILLEASDLASRRALIFRPDQMNMEYLLNQREQETIKILNARYHLKFQKHPWEDEELVYYLGDNASYGNSWSACSGKIPTFRCNSSHGLYWMPNKSRWLTARERLTSMGWPCIQSTASSMQLPLFGAKDTKRASDLVGNAMHWQTASVMQLISLVCFGPSEPLPF